jgi:hypothetical protein
MSSVVGYASSQVGQKVGDGECTRLAERALEAAGKKTTKDFGVVGNTADYVWGTLVDIYSAMPGDIVQFRGHTLRVETTTETGGGDIKTHKRPHHTAVITSKSSREDDYGRKYFMFSILEQNQSGKRFVHKNKIQFQKSQEKLSNGEVTTESNGQYWIYRPVSK